MSKTPHEEAERLVQFFIPKMYCYLGSGMLSDNYDLSVATSFAKECAVFHVKGLIELLTECEYKCDSVSNFASEISHYQSVLKHLEA